MMQYKVGIPVEITVTEEARKKKHEVTIGIIEEYKPNGWIVVNGQTFWIGLDGQADLRTWKARPYEGEIPVKKPVLKMHNRKFGSIGRKALK